MLVLSRHKHESVVLGGGEQGLANIMVVDIRGDKVRLGIEAPATLPVHRLEIHRAIAREHKLPPLGTLLAAGRLHAPDFCGSSGPSLWIQCPDYAYLRGCLEAGFVQFGTSLEQRQAVSA